MLNKENTNNVIIAIDGPTGSGKSTIAKKLAQDIDYIYIDTGAMFRAITYYYLHNNIFDEASCCMHLNKINIKIINDGINLNGKNLFFELRTKEIDENVSLFSSFGCVRKFLLDFQREISKNKNVIMDGRDIATTVFPNADYKFFLDASTDIRAKRRFIQRPDGLSYEEIKQKLIKRDEYDSKREKSPLKMAEDSLYIDTSDLSIEEVLCKLKKIIKLDF